MAIKFLRRDWHILSKLGKRRKKKQIWRRPTGRDNKMREKRRGYPLVVSIGYKKPESEKKKFKIVMNIKDLEKIRKDEIAIIGKVGKKKRLKIEKVAKEKKIKIQNLKKKEDKIKEEKNELKK